MLTGADCATAVRLPSAGHVDDDGRVQGEQRFVCTAPLLTEIFPRVRMAVWVLTSSC